jgi:hypothetical protein
MGSKQAVICALLAVAFAGCASGDDDSSKTSGAKGNPTPGMGTPIPGGIAGAPAAPTNPSMPSTPTSKPGGPLGSAGSAPTTGAGGTGAVAMGGSMGAAGSMAPSMGAAGSTAAAGSSGAAGSGDAGSGDMGAAGSAPPAMVGSGMCCSDGNCLCHGDLPADLTSKAGPFKTATINMQSGTAYYPTDAEPPFAAIAICPGFLNTGPEMTPWGPFYASWGIVTVVTNTGAADIPDIRAQLLLGAIDELKKMNSGGSGPLMGKLSGRYGTSGYSMGGGGTTIAAAGTPDLKTSIGLAPWGGVGNGNKVPELLLCGDVDTVAPCDMASSVYSTIPGGTPKMMVVCPGATHFNWFDPADAGGGMSGKYALAFQKVYLEGDTRWTPLLMKKISGATVQSADIK